MAEPSTPDQIQQFSLVTDQEISPNESFWVGLTYNSTVDKYLWLSNNMEITNPYWEDNQPLTGVGECVVFYQLKLHSSPCNVYRSLICQNGNYLLQTQNVFSCKFKTL